MRQMRMSKETVRIEDLTPNPNNPRKDFGDVHALAERLRVTGGQPVQPLVVVADGGRYMIVDGDRRYRAMLELGTAECECLVCGDWSEADQALAMVATDDKKQLDQAERARGMQLMLALDVSDEDAGTALGLEAEQVRRVRRARRSFEGVQADLDVMIAAAEDGLSDEERAEVIEAGSKGGGYAARAAAGKIRERHEHHAKYRAIVAALGEGFEVSDEDEPGWTKRSEMGLRYVEQLRSTADAERFVTDHMGDRRRFLVYRGWGGAAAVLTDSPAEASEAEETEEQREARERVEAHAVAWRDMLADMVRWACSADFKARTELAGDVRKHVRTRYDREVDAIASLGLEDGEGLQEAALGCVPSTYEVLELMGSLSSFRHGLYTSVRSTDTDKFRRDSLRVVFDAYEGAGWVPSEAALDIRGLACETLREDADA